MNRKVVNSMLLLLLLAAVVQSYDDIHFSSIRWNSDKYIISYVVEQEELNAALVITAYVKMAVNFPDNENVVGVMVDTMSIAIHVDRGFFGYSISERDITLSSTYVPGMRVSEVDSPSEDQITIKRRPVEYKNKSFDIPYSVYLQPLKNNKCGRLFNIE